MLIRPMTPDDVATAERISDEAFYGVDQQHGRRSDPPPRRRTPGRSERWVARTHGFLETDAGGCWVAEADGGEVVGFATSLVREDLWVLVTFAVAPGQQGAGIGARLLERAQEHGAGCSRAMLCASDDPRALRRYHAAGFELLPQLLFRGTPRRSPGTSPGDSPGSTRGSRPGRSPGALPAPAAELRAATDEDLAWMDDLDRDLRGGPHGPDHRALAAMATPWVPADPADRSGYAYASAAELFVLAARDEDAARRLLRAVLARARDTFEISHVTTANRWAVDEAMAAGLSMSTAGFLAVRGMGAPAPYVHNGALL